MISHELMGGNLHVYRRENSRFWQCATYLRGKNRRVSTKQESLAQAKDFAEDWYLGLRAKDRLGLIRNEKTFRQAADQFLKEYEIITEGSRSPKWVAGYGIRLRLHLLPFFGDLGLSEIPSGIRSNPRHFSQSVLIIPAVRYIGRNQDPETFRGAPVERPLSPS